MIPVLEFGRCLSRKRCSC